MAANIDNFPALKEFRKQGNLVDLMRDKGWDGLEIHSYLKFIYKYDIFRTMFLCEETDFDLILEESVYLIINYSKHK